MKRSMMGLLFVASLLGVPFAASGESHSARAFRLTPEHASLAGTTRARIEKYANRLKAERREAFAALTRGLFEYTLRVRAVVENVGGLGIGLRAALGTLAQRSLVRAMARSRGVGRGLVNAVVAQWRPLFRALRRAFADATGHAVVEALETRFHAVTANARALFYGAIAQAGGTVRALLAGLSESLQPRLRALAEAARKAPAATRRRFEAARAKPVS